MSLQKFSHFFSEVQPSPVQNIAHPDCIRQSVRVDVKRDDLLHPIVSGNKWRKLKHLLLHIESLGYQKLACMGGAHSNLLHALSYLSYRMGWRLDLFVRGYKEQQLSSTLRDAVAWGASVHYVNREIFRKIRFSPPQLNEDVFWLAEGAFHDLAFKGAAELVMELPNQYDYIVLATATGASLIGMSIGQAKKNKSVVGSSITLPQALGIAVLNNAVQLEDDIQLIAEKKLYDFKAPKIQTGYEFGGYAKKNTELLKFIDEFALNYQIPLEPVYSGKSFYATFDLIKQGYFPKQSKILLVHCGGLQGKRGFDKKIIQ